MIKLRVRFASPSFNGLRLLVMSLQRTISEFQSEFETELNGIHCRVVRPDLLRYPFVKNTAEGALRVYSEIQKDVWSDGKILSPQQISTEFHLKNKDSFESSIYKEQWAIHLLITTKELASDTIFLAFLTMLIINGKIQNGRVLSAEVVAGDPSDFRDAFELLQSTDSVGEPPYPLDSIFSFCKKPDLFIHLESEQIILASECGHAGIQAYFVSEKKDDTWCHTEISDQNNIYSFNTKWVLIDKRSHDLLAVSACVGSEQGPTLVIRKDPANHALLEVSRIQMINPIHDVKQWAKVCSELSFNGVFSSIECLDWHDLAELTNHSLLKSLLGSILYLSSAINKSGYPYFILSDATSSFEMVSSAGFVPVFCGNISSLISFIEKVDENKLFSGSLNELIEIALDLGSEPQNAKENNAGVLVC